jgi:RNA polymerase sigma factor (sigma-70 family)
MDDRSSAGIAVGDAVGRVAEHRDADPDETALRAALIADLDTGFARLVTTYQDLVFSLALRSTAHRADAEDLAAEAFLRAFRALRAYDEDRLTALAVRPWLVTVVLNTARNRARDRDRRPTLGDAEPPESPDAGPSVEDRVETAEQGRELAEHLAALPEKQRLAVVLRHVVDLPVAEVAAVLGCGENTARSHAARGLARLRNRLGAPRRPEGRDTP